MLYPAVYQSYPVTIKDFCIEGTIENNLDLSQYPVAGITTDTTRYPNALKIAKLAKKSGSFVVMGGPRTQFAYEEALNTNLIDCIVGGEGESYTF